MSLSLFFAQLIGCYLVLLSLAMLIHHVMFKKIIQDFLMSPTLIVLTGSLTLISGLVILIPHNLWIAEWPVVVTIIGWIFLVKGAMRLFFPYSYVKFAKYLLDKKGFLLVSWIWFLIGIYLIWAGFTHYNG